MKKITRSIIALSTVVLLGGFGTFTIVEAVDDSIAINSTTLVLTTDADSNNYANIGDTVTLTVTVTNTDGDVVETVTADMRAYGGSATESVALTTDNAGTADVFTLVHVITDGGGSAIDVAANNAASAVTVTVTDPDEIAPMPTDASNNLGDGTVDSTATNGVDTDAPSNQDSVLASSVSVAPGASVTLASSGAASNNVWLAPTGTTSFTAGSTMTTAASGTATTILAPSSTGQYKLYVIDDANNLSSASSATVGVANNGGGGGNAVMLASNDDTDDSNDANDVDDNNDNDEESDGSQLTEKPNRNVVISLMSKVLKSDLSVQVKVTLFKLFAKLL